MIVDLDNQIAQYKAMLLNKYTDEADNCSLFSKFDEICSYHLARFLNDAGIAISPLSSLDRLEIYNSLRIQNEYKLFYDFIIQYLFENKVIKIDKDEFYFLKTINELEDIASSYIHDITKNQPEILNTIELLQNTINSYADILSGALSPLSLLYPNGDINFLSNSLGLFSQSHYLGELKDVILNFLIQNYPNSGLNILEVGGGSGALTWHLKSFIEKNKSYEFSDISRFFILRAQQEAEKNKLTTMRFSMFDLNNIENRRESLKQYDILLAFNVLHVINDPEKTLSQLFNMLKPEGLLITLESTHIPNWLALIWGILPEWWRRDKFRNQLNSPLLQPSYWYSLFDETPFSKTYFLPDSTNLGTNQDALLMISHK